MISLQSVKDNDGTDLINEVFTAMYVDGYLDDAQYAVYKDKPAKAIWATYRYRFMNTCCSEKYVNRWKQRFADTAYNLLERYDLIFKAYEALKTEGNMTGLTSKSLIQTTEVSSGQSTDHDDYTNSTENIPAYADAQDGQWLSERTRNDGTETKNYGNNVTGTTTTDSALGLLPAELADRMRKSLFNPYTEYAQEFEQLFMPFYADECCCEECR